MSARSLGVPAAIPTSPVVMRERCAQTVSNSCDATRWGAAHRARCRCVFVSSAEIRARFQLAHDERRMVASRSAEPNERATPSLLDLALIAGSFLRRQLLGFGSLLARASRSWVVRLCVAAREARLVDWPALRRRSRGFASLLVRRDPLAGARVTRRRFRLPRREHVVHGHQPRTRLRPGRIISTPVREAKAHPDDVAGNVRRPIPHVPR